MKRTKEFYVLMAITVVVPVLILLGMWGFNATLYSFIGHENFTVNDTVATFTLDYKTYTKNLSATFIANTRYIMNRSELDAMEYGVTYTCNITKPEMFDMNNTLSDCVRL